MRTKPEWYWNSVKERENRLWTSFERMHILKLREQKRLSIPLIANRMKASTNQINNQLRIFRKAMALRCRQCGNPLEEERKNIVISEHKSTLCKKCEKEQLEYKRILRTGALKKGLCGYCMVRKVIPGTCACRKCLSATYRRRRLEKQCIKCGNPSPDRAFCPACSKENAVLRAFRGRELV